MTRIYQIYKPYFTALLLCILQIAGMDVYAQGSVEATVPDSVTVREAPKARARRHREISRTEESDSLKSTSAMIGKDSLIAVKMDSIPLKVVAPAAVADSIERINQENLEQIETAFTPPQPKDSIPAPAIPETVWTPNPTKATWLAVVFPGGGQIYNRKYWKLPIIYGGFAGCAYALSWNGKMYKDYSQAYLDIMDSDPNTNSHLEIRGLSNYPESQQKDLLRRRKDTFRRYRDLSIFAFIGVYLISVIDAYVDAELSNFDITPDLSMRVEPAIINDQFHSQNKSVGLQCSFRF